MENQENEGSLLAALTDGQKEELDLAFEESFDSENLLSHEQIKSRHAKWLETGE